MHISPHELIAALKSEGLRITRARRAICAVLAGAHQEHLSAADILERARAAAEVAIDQSTVYRTLDVLQGLGIIRHVHLGHGPGVFHFADETGHHHLVCESCGKSVEVPLEELQPILTEVTEHYGFTADSFHFALSGKCHDCAEAAG